MKDSQYRSNQFNKYRYITCRVWHGGTSIGRCFPIVAVAVVVVVVVVVELVDMLMLLSEPLVRHSDLGHDCKMEAAVRVNCSRK